MDLQNYQKKKEISSLRKIICFYFEFIRAKKPSQFEMVFQFLAPLKWYICKLF